MRHEPSCIGLSPALTIPFMAGRFILGPARYGPQALPTISSASQLHRGFRHMPIIPPPSTHALRLFQDPGPTSSMNGGCKLWYLSGSPAHPDPNIWTRPFCSPPTTVISLPASLHSRTLTTLRIETESRTKYLS